MKGKVKAAIVVWVFSKLIRIIVICHTIRIVWWLSMITSKTRGLWPYPLSGAASGR